MDTGVSKNLFVFKKINLLEAILDKPPRGRQNHLARQGLRNLGNDGAPATIINRSGVY